MGFFGWVFLGGFFLCQPCDGRTTRSKTSTKKVWVLLVTCLVTRAIHTEVVASLDVSSFLLGMRRFYSIRGYCRTIRSDQGTNFVGARNQIINLKEVQSDAQIRGIEWKLNPPRASSAGGIWERKIGSVKRIFEATLLGLGKRSVSREELDTFFKEAAAIVNDTPLYSISQDPNDPAPITPAMLLTLRDAPQPPALESFTERDLLQYGAGRWKRVMYLAEQFWSRWRRSYLQDLQSRSIWRKPNSLISVGDVVLLKGSTKRGDWPMGVVETIKPGRDGRVRSIIIKTSGSEDGSSRFLERSVRDTVLLIPSAERG